MNAEGAITQEFVRRWIKDWAYSPMPAYPEQDWDIIISNPQIAGDLFDMVESQNSPKDIAFLSILYLTVGDMARSIAPIDPQSPIFLVIERGLTSRDPRLKRWAERSKEIFDFRSNVNYENWCDGGYARQEKASRENEIRPFLIDRNYRLVRNSPLRVKYPGKYGWKVWLEDCSEFLEDCKGFSCAVLGCQAYRHEERFLSHRFDLLFYTSIPRSGLWADFAHHSCDEIDLKIKNFAARLPEDAKEKNYSLNSSKFMFHFTVFSGPNEEWG